MSKTDFDSDAVYDVLFVISGDDFDLDQVSLALKWTPWQTWKKGEKRSFVKQDGTIHYFEGTHENSGWKLLSEHHIQNSSIEEQLEYWLHRLEEKREAIEWISRSNLDMELVCATFDDCETMNLNSALLRGLGNLGIDIEIIFYGDQD